MIYNFFTFFSRQIGPIGYIYDLLFSLCIIFLVVKLIKGLWSFIRGGS